MKIGDTLAGRYELRAMLGAGGLGEAFVARDTRSRRDVAVKVFDSARCPADRLAAMATLLASASRVDHPALVLPKIQVGLSERPPFVVSEYVAGEDLAALLAREKRVPWQRALTFALSCAEGLAAVVKATGKPHRALKPGNVRITSNGEPRVLDYGIAELGVVDPPRPRDDGSFVEYRAPEQIQGAPLDARTDVFALGVLLFEILTGVHPFTGPTAHKAAWKISMPTFSVQPSQLAPGTPLPSQVEKLLIRALARAPAERFKDLTEMAHHLALVLRSPGAPTHARGTAPPTPDPGEELTQTLPAATSADDLTTAISLPVLRRPLPATKPSAPNPPTTTLTAKLQSAGPAEACMPLASPAPPPSGTPSVAAPQPTVRPELPDLSDDEQTESLPAPRPPSAPLDPTLVLDTSRDSTLVLDAPPAKPRPGRDLSADDETTTSFASMTRTQPSPPVLEPSLSSLRDAPPPRTALVSLTTVAIPERGPSPGANDAAPGGKLLWINAICVILIAVLAVFLLMR